jgi:hypothetical protein
VDSVAYNKYRQRAYWLKLLIKICSYGWVRECFTSIFRGNRWRKVRDGDSWNARSHALLSFVTPFWPPDSALWFFGGISGCEWQGCAERTGEAIDEAIEDAGEALVQVPVGTVAETHYVEEL